MAASGLLLRGMSDRSADAGGLLLLGVALVSAAMMATEIALTRVLSVTVWYHFAFFAISVALLGTGLSALLVHAAQARLLGRAWRSWCAALALAQALFTLLLAFGLSRVTPDWFGGMTGAFTLFTWKLGLVFSLAVLPFACGGMVLSLAAARFGPDVHRMYFVDLGGAALGCLATIPLLSAFGGPSSLAACAALATVGALVFMASEHGEERAAGVRKPLVVAALVLSAAELLCVATPVIALRSAKGVDLTRVKPELTAWNSFSLVNVFGQQGFRGWGLSPRYRGPLPEQKSLVIDMNALTSIARFDGDFSKVEYVQHDLSSLVYRSLPAGDPPDEVCVIGAGGGKDVLSALAAGSRHVVAVEINPLIVRNVMHGAYRDFSGGLYERPDVQVVESDGRAYLRASDRTFDVILISMVDTSAATAAGAYALTENGLYTHEAFEEFMSRLRPGGVLTVSTVSLPGLAVGARLAALARAALRTRGKQAANAVAVVRTPWSSQKDAELYDVLIKPDGFSATDTERLRAAVDELGFVPAYFPHLPNTSARDEDALVHKILRAKDDAALARTLAAYPLDASAVDDDRPFFFYQNRFSDFVAALGPAETTHLFGNGLRVLAKVLVLAGLMLLLCAVLPLLWLRRGSGVVVRALDADLGFVACLGVGFMCVEIALVHRVTLFLGQPTYTLVSVLFVMLCAGGLGSRWIARMLGRAGRRGAWLLVAVGLSIATLPSVTNALFRIAGAGALPLRALVAALAIAPIGLLLGAPLPAALALAAKRDRSRLAWLWGVNGASSVLGSILATLVSLHLGTRMTLLCGAAAYFLAALLWRRLFR